MQESEEADASAAPRSAAQAQLEAVTIFALIAALGGALSGAAPTGTTWWDPLLTAMLAGAFVAAASKANQAVLVAVAGLAAALVGFNPWLIFGLGGFALAFAAGLRPARKVEMQAAAGALTITALLHLKAFGFFGLVSAIAGVAVLAVFASWYRNTNAVAQRRARRSVGMVLLLALVASAVAGALLLSVRSSATQGIDAARAGLTSARAGDAQELTRQLDIAADRLSSANDKISSPLIKPLLLLPVAAQHVRAVTVASGQGAQVATEARAMATEADLGQLELRQGQFDLDLLTSMAPRLERISTGLETSLRRIEQVRSGWLLPQIDDRMQSFAVEIADVAPEAWLALEAARVMPAMLGVDEERRYLMLFGSPGESREFGGFVGGYALLGIRAGRIDLVDSGSVNDLRFENELDLLPFPEEFDDPSSYPTQFIESDPITFPQNLTSTPNLADILRATQEIFPEMAGAPLDGVIYADPFALGAFVQFIGPVTVPGVDAPLDRQGVSRFILDGQYRLFDTRTERFDAMGALAIATADAFIGADLPGPERLGRIIGPLARAGRLQIITNDDRENQFLTSVFLQRNFVAPTSIDSFAVIQTNGTESKLDLFLDRQVHYDVRTDDGGGLQATVDVTVRSTIPADAPPLTFGNTDGTNKVLLSLYSPHELTSLTVDGEPHEYVAQREYGFFRYALFTIPVAPNTATQVRFELAGDAPPGPYRVGVWSQPLVNPDTVQVTYRGPDGHVSNETKELAENWVFDPATSTN